MTKRSWGPSNPLWRWQHRKGKTKSRGKNMARRRSRGRGRSRGGMGGIVKSALIGGIVGMYGGSILPGVDSRILGAGAAYMFGGKSIQSAAVGGISAMVAPGLLHGVMGSGPNSVVGYG